MKKDLLDKEKKKIFIYIIAIFIIVSLLAVILIFNNKIFMMEYSYDNVTFRYPSNFKVRSSDDGLIVSSRDDMAKIEISIRERENNYLSSEYEDIANGVFNDFVKSTDYSILSNECIDHMCTSLYDYNSDTIKIVVEFRENVLVTYKLEVSSSKFDKYNDGFDTVVNSLVVDSDD